MNNKTIRWMTNLLLCIGTGFMVTGAAALLIGDVVEAEEVRTGASMAVVSFFVIVASYVVAVLEEDL
ncbi:MULTISPECIES: hypothetical protein [Pseudomonas]|uniref:DUF2964 family protein n=1 Tax=Pseudomonas ekonensis TaxID=2842353 RepID=A0ABS6PAM9_9PSED|nr:MULTISPECIES: hypothetical protein [Pseudomonas]MBV4457530.1 hypothetical protein [Pseudomonas ekonensis]